MDNLYEIFNCVSGWAMSIKSSIVTYLLSSSRRAVYINTYNLMTTYRNFSDCASHLMPFYCFHSACKDHCFYMFQRVFICSSTKLTCFTWNHSISDVALRQTSPDFLVNVKAIKSYENSRGSKNRDDEKELEHLSRIKGTRLSLVCPGQWQQRRMGR